MPTFNSLKTEYKRLWDRMTIKSSVIPSLDKVARGIIADRKRYEAVEATTGVPWFWIGITHNRESGRNFKTHLHNGDPLTARTRQVPKGRPIHGRPPFKWETSAEDALIYQALDKVPDDAIPDVKNHLEQALRTAKDAMETKRLETAKVETRKRLK